MVSLTGSAMAKIPATRSSTPTKMAVAPSPRSRSAWAVSAAGVEALLVRKLALPITTRWSSTVPTAPLPVGESKSVTSGMVRPRLGGGVDDGAGERVLGGAFDAGGEPEQLVVARSPADATIWVTDGLAFGQGAGLVDDEGVDLLHPLERFGVLDQDAEPGAAADADHDRHGRGQPERTGAGDDQDGDGDDQRVREAGVGPDGGPDEERDDGDGDDGGHEPGGDPVGHPLDRCAGALRLGDHLHDPGQHRVAADLVGAHDQRPGLVQGAADDGVAGRSW